MFLVVPLALVTGSAMRADDGFAVAVMREIEDFPASLVLAALHEVGCALAVLRSVDCHICSFLWDLSVHVVELGRAQAAVWLPARRSRGWKSSASSPSLIFSF